MRCNLSKTILLANALSATTFAQAGAAPQGKGVFDPSFIMIMLLVLGIVYFIVRKKIYASIPKKIKITKKCVQCNQLYDDDKKFCNKCGKPLEALKK